MHGPYELNSSLAKRPIRYRFHPLIRFPMLAISLAASAYILYVMIFLIPRVQDPPFWIRAVSVIVLYVALNSLYRHLTALNSVIIRVDKLELRFLLRRAIFIPWENLHRMEIFKLITHHWKIVYSNYQGRQKIFKTSLAFPGIWDILVSIQNHKPEIELNELLKQVLLYKRSIGKV